MSDILNRFNDLEEESEILEANIISEKYLTFIIDKQFYAYHISDVREIIEMQEITPVPEFPDYAKGIINLRGNLIPIIDVRLRFCKNEAEYNDRTCIIILNLDIDVGFIVDTVDEVLDIRKENISPVPKLADSGSRKFIEGVGKTAKKMVMILNAKKMLNDNEIQSLNFDPNTDLDVLNIEL